jgi:predicted dinucleotide-binding enzyme
MSTIGIIGSGVVGSTVARLAVAAGHDVVLSNSRGPQTLQELLTAYVKLTARRRRRSSSAITRPTQA